MKERGERSAAAVSLIFGYLAIVGVGVCKAMKAEKPPSNGAKSAGPGELRGESRNGKNEREEKLQSLSLGTPGDAPLDRLARRAADEEREEERVEATGGTRELTRPKPTGPPQAWTRDSPSVAEVLRHQSLESKPLEGWSIPMPERLPVPTFAPAVMALGIIIFAMGLATIWYVCVVGAIVFAIAAWRWTGELQGG
jgi:hypothetical protein